MPRISPIQASFAGGEVSPRLRGRVDTELYRKALARCENWDPRPEGPVLMRSGSRFVTAPSGLGQTARVVEFPVADSDSMALVLGGGKLRVYSPTGDPLQVGQVDYVKNSAFTYGFLYWTRLAYSSAYPYSGSPYELSSSDYAVFYRKKTYLKHVINAWQGGSSLVFGALRQAVALPVGTWTLRFRVALPNYARVVCRVGTTAGGSDIGSYQMDGVGSDLSVVLEGAIGVVMASAGTVYVEVAAGRSGAGLVPALGQLGTQDVGVDVGADGDTVKVWARLDAISIQAAAGGAVEFDVPWTDSELHAVQRVSDTRKDRCFFFHRNHPPQELIYEQTLGTWTFQAVSFTAPSGGWGWAANCYPASGELYQGRLWLGGVPGMSNTFWASKSGDPYTFTRGSTASDAISLDVSTKGAIVWLQGHRSLLLGTDRGEYSIVANGGVVTVTDFTVRPESSFGSAPVQAASIGDRVLYVSPDRRKVRVLSYNLQENGYQSREISLWGAHLLEAGIVEHAWSAGTDTLYCLLADGSVAGVLFYPDEKVAAWHRVTVGAEVVSLDVTDGPSGAKLWFLVRRAGGICLEQLDLRADGPYVDSHVVRVPDGGVVDGLEHLEGATVRAQLDTGEFVDGLVVQDGKATVGLACASATVGVAYRATARLLPFEGGNPAGTSQNMKRRWVKVVLRMNDSAVPLVNGSRAQAVRHPSTPMGTVEPRMTGDVETHTLGWDDAGQLLIEQDVPIRTEVLAVFGVFQGNEA